MIYYYDKENDIYISSESPLIFNQNVIRITEEEYLAAITAPEPTEEEIRAEKEAQLRALMAELYPAEEEK